MPKPKPIRDAVLEKALAGYTKDPSTIDVFSAKDKQYSKKVNAALHENLPASSVKNELAAEPVKTLLDVSSGKDQEFVSSSFGHKYRIALKPAKPTAKPVKNDPTLAKAVAGYTKDTSKIDVFSAQDKFYSQQVNHGLSHHMPPSSLKTGTPEQAPGTTAKKVDNLLNVSSGADQDFVSRSFGAKSRQ